MDRRRFLLLFGATSSGLVLAGHGRVGMPRRLALLAGGACSFCHSLSEPVALAGVIGRPARLCDVCSALLSWLADGGRAGARPTAARAAASPLAAIIADEELTIMIERPDSERGLLERMRRFPTREIPRPALDRVAVMLAAEVAAAPTDLRPRLKLGDVLAMNGNAAAATAQYALAATAYRSQGFFLKAVAVLKQTLRLDPHLWLGHELADLYEALGLHAEAQASRAPAHAPSIDHCSFCGIDRNAGISFAGVGDRVCLACVREADALFRDHRSA